MESITGENYTKLIIKIHYNKFRVGCLFCLHIVK